MMNPPPLYEEEPHAYSDEELAQHLANRPLKNVLERITAHNYDLIQPTLDWTNYLAGKGSEPKTDIGRLVNPKMFKPVNDAEKNIKDLITIMKNDGEGRTPFVSVMTIAHNTSLTLVDRLARLKMTPHIVHAEEAIRQIFYYARYNGYPTMAQEEYEHKLDELYKTFIDACSANAALLSNYVVCAKARKKESEAPDYLAKIASHTNQIRQDVSGIREGRTGAEAQLHEDPLSPPKRRQVNLVKKRYYEHIKENPNYSLLSVSRGVWNEDKKKGISGGYATASALNARASREIKREQAGQSPFWPPSKF